MKRFGILLFLILLLLLNLPVKGQAANCGAALLLEVIAQNRLQRDLDQDVLSDFIEKAPVLFSPHYEMLVREELAKQKLTPAELAPISEQSAAGNLKLDNLLAARILQRLRQGLRSAAPDKPIVQ